MLSFYLQIYRILLVANIEQNQLMRSEIQILTTVVVLLLTIPIYIYFFYFTDELILGIFRQLVHQFKILRII